MSSIPWTPYDPNVKLTPAQIEEGIDSKKISEEEAQVLTLNSARNWARSSPLNFALAYTPRTERYPHIDLLSETITALIEDRLFLPSGETADNLVVTMPPRHGKSYLISEHTPAWYLSRYPDNRVILTSYADDFAAQWGKKSKDLLSSVGDDFGLQVDPESKANARWDLRGFRGGMQTAGMGGQITGKGGNLLIGDDWVKNSEEANSPTWRENAWDWTISTFLSRREPGAKTILLMTRWNDDDPVGRLLRQEPDQWHIIDLPAIAREDDPLGRSPGTALCPQRYDEEALEKIRKTMGSHWFSSLYQGRPTPESGGLFSQENMRYWRYPSGQGNEAQGRAFDKTYVLLTPEGVQKYVPVSDCFHFITCDLAVSSKRTADYTVFGLFAYTPNGDLLLTAMTRDRIEGPDHLDRLNEFVALSRLTGREPKFVGIEEATYGLSLIQTAIRHGMFIPRALKADKDKITRAIPASSLAKNGQLYLPKDHELLEEIHQELFVFDHGAHDDIVDVIAYAAFVVTNLLGSRKPGKEGRWDDFKASSSIRDRLERYTSTRTTSKRKARQRARNRL